MLAKIFLFVFILIQSPSFCVRGELIFKYLQGTTVGTFDLAVTSSNYSWHWENNAVELDNTLYSHSVADVSAYYFDAPKSIDDGDYPISWGLMEFNITTNTGKSRTFTIDLRDVNWSTDYTTHDTYILIDDPNNRFYICKGDGITAGTFEYINISSFFEIWDFWDEGTPSQSNFKVPVTMYNQKLCLKSLSYKLYSNFTTKI